MTPLSRRKSISDAFQCNKFTMRRDTITSAHGMEWQQYNKMGIGFEIRYLMKTKQIIEWLSHS